MNIMQKNASLLVLMSAFSILLWAFLPLTTQAYFTTGQRVIKLNDSSALFLIDFVFGHEKHEVHIPLAAHNGTGTSPYSLSYSVLDKSGEIAEGTAAGIVLSEAPLQTSGMYIVPKNMAKKFTLAVFYKNVAAEQKQRYHLQVNHLPFMFDGSQQLQLNPSELESYRTESTGL